MERQPELQEKGREHPLAITFRFEDHNGLSDKYSAENQKRRLAQAFHKGDRNIYMFELYYNDPKVSEYFESAIKKHDEWRVPFALVLSGLGLNSVEFKSERELKKYSEKQKKDAEKGDNDAKYNLYQIYLFKAIDELNKEGYGIQVMIEGINDPPSGKVKEGVRQMIAGKARRSSLTALAQLSKDRDEKLVDQLADLKSSTDEDTYRTNLYMSRGTGHSIMTEMMPDDLRNCIVEASVDNDVDNSTRIIVSDIERIIEKEKQSKVGERELMGFVRKMLKRPHA